MQHIISPKSSRPLLLQLQEASGTNPRERSGAAIGDGSERNVEEGSVSTVSLPEDISTKWIECFDDTSRAVYYYNDATVSCRFSSSKYGYRLKSDGVIFMIGERLCRNIHSEYLISALSFEPANRLMYR